MTQLATQLRPKLPTDLRDFASRALAMLDTPKYAGKSSWTLGECRAFWWDVQTKPAPRVGEQQASSGE